MLRVDAFFRRDSEAYLHFEPIVNARPAEQVAAHRCGRISSGVQAQAALRIEIVRLAAGLVRFDARRSIGRERVRLSAGIQSGEQRTVVLGADRQTQLDQTRVADQFVEPSGRAVSVPLSEGGL